MRARPVARDEPGDPVCYAVALHVLMSQAEMELWESFADRHRLQMDDAMHAAALSGLKYRLKHAGDESGTHVAAVCERALLARLNPPSWSGCPVAGLQAQPR